MSDILDYLTNTLHPLLTVNLHSSVCLLHPQTLERYGITSERLKETLKYRYITRSKGAGPLLKHSHKVALNLGLARTNPTEARHYYDAAKAEMDKRYSGKRSQRDDPLKPLLAEALMLTQALVD